MSIKIEDILIEGAVLEARELSKEEVKAIVEKIEEAQDELANQNRMTQKKWEQLNKIITI